MFELVLWGRLGAVKGCMKSEDTLLYNDMTLIASSTFFRSQQLLIVLLLMKLFSVSGCSNTDHPIATSGDPIYLDGDDWIAFDGASSSSLTIPASVPGDIITDLQLAKIIEDPYYELNWIQKQNIDKWNRPWTYQRNFTVPSTTSDDVNIKWWLVLDGVKMGAKVSLNGKDVGLCKDQFLRYMFELPPLLAAINNTLEIAFQDRIDEEGRFMACTGGWDWAPYSYTAKTGTRSGKNVSTFSKGIWRSIYLLPMRNNNREVAITYLTPQTKYLGSYPTKLLEDSQHGGFAVNVTVHVWVPGDHDATGSIQVEGSWSKDAINSTSILHLKPGKHAAISLHLTARANDILLWWPAGVGMGQQPLYNITASWHPDKQGLGVKNSIPVVSSIRRMGFRVVALVTTNDTAASVAQQQTGSGTHGMFFRVNGAALYSRGANMVPMEELEGRSTGKAHRILVKSAADAGMNTLRVWGGGIFLPRAFYDACDDYGILVYHDMQFASSVDGPHGPSATSKTQEAELRHQIRRLSHHASISLWDGVNEVVVGPNDSSEIFASFVMTIVAQEDQSRAIWPSSPAAGWVTGVDSLYGTPNGQPLTTHGGGHIWNQGIETHAPYQLGSGWPVVNSGADDRCWDRYHQVHAPAVLNNGTKLGVQEKNVYASEFGVTGSPSFESLSPTLAQEHWGIHGGMEPDSCTGPCQSLRKCTTNNPMAQRNYACDAGIRLFMGDNLSVGLNDTGIYALQGQTYLCQLVQALDQKSVIEGRRGQNQFGALIWMLNDIWPSISWGSIEYGSVGFTNGQLLGGRWKLMHYFYKQSLFSDVVANCGYQYSKQRPQEKWVCYVKNDRAGREFHGKVRLKAYSLMGDGIPEIFLQRPVALPAGPGSAEWFDPGTMPNPNTTALVATILDENGMVASEHLMTLTLPKNLRVPAAKVTFEISADTNPDGTIDIHVTSDRVALWVTLTSGAQGRFSDNAFFLPATTKTVQFVPFCGFDSTNHRMLKESLRVEDFSSYAQVAPQDQDETETSML